MVVNAHIPYLVTFRFTGELSAIFNLEHQELQLVSIQQESEDDARIEDDQEDEVVLKAMGGDPVVSSIVAQIDQFIADPPDNNSRVQVASA